MTKTLDLYFDFGSPTAYLAYKRLLQLSSQYGLTINYIPILLGGIFKASGNTSPVSVAAKGKYMLEADLPRFAKRYDVALNFNPHFPINTLPLMRGAIAAQQLNCFDAYAEAIYNGFWVAQKNLGELDTISATLSSAGIDAEALLAKAMSSNSSSPTLTRQSPVAPLAPPPCLWMARCILARIDSILWNRRWQTARLD